MSSKAAKYLSLGLVAITFVIIDALADFGVGHMTKGSHDGWDLCATLALMGFAFLVVFGDDD